MFNLEGNQNMSHIEMLEIESFRGLEKVILKMDKLR